MACIIGLKWNLRITVIPPYLSPQNLFQDSEEADVLIIHNGNEGLEGHYTSTGEYLQIIHHFI